jgi:hypothetical protein
MTESSDQMARVRREFQAVTRDLGCMSGALREIATVWRRVRSSRPDLPLRLPLQLDAGTHQLARIVNDLAWNAPSQRPGPALLMVEQMAALERDLAAARAMTCGAGVPPVGDSGLWERVGAAMRQARARVPDRYLPQGEDSANKVSNPAGASDLGPMTPRRMALRPAGLQAGS